MRCNVNTLRFVVDTAAFTESEEDLEVTKPMLCIRNNISCYTGRRAIESHTHNMWAAQHLKMVLKKSVLYKVVSYKF